MNVKSFATLRLTSGLLEVLPDQPILPSARAFEAVIQTTTALAHPPYLPGRHAGHQGVIFHVLGHDGTGGDKRALPYRMTAHDRAIRAERCAFAHARTRVNPVHREVRPRGDDVREHAGRTAENVVLQLDAIIDGHVVLDPDAVSDADLARHVHVLSQRAVRTDHSPALDMAEMPNLGAGADGGAGIHVAALVHEIILHLQNFNVVTRGDPLRGVFRVEDGLGVLLHEGIVHLRMVRGDDHDVGTLHEFLSQFLLPFVPLPFVAELRDERIEEDDVGPFLPEPLDYLDRRGLAVVVDVLLVSDTQYQHLRAFQRLGKPLVEHVRNASNAILGHPVVNHHRRLDHRGVKPVFARFPAQVVRVQRDAVTAQARARIERRKAERLRLRRLDHLPKVDPHLVAEDRQFVDQADVDVPVGVLQNLRHLGDRRRRSAENLVLQNGLVHGRNDVGSVLSQTAHDLRRILRLEIDVAGVHAFRGEAQIEVLAALEAGRFEDGLDQFFSSSRIGRGLKHHHHPLVEIPRDGAGRRFDVADVGLLVGVKRGGNADRDEIDVPDETEVGGGGEPPFGDERGQVRIDDVADIVVARVHQVHLLLLNIETNGPETRLRLLYGQRKSNIAEANDPGYDGSILDFL